MAKPTHLPGSSVEEIIASIRGGMGVEESKVDEETPETSETAEEKRSAGNVSKLFGDEPVVEPLETEGFGPDVLTDVTPSEIGQSETEEPVEAKEIPPDGGGGGVGASKYPAGRVALVANHRRHRCGRCEPTGEHVTDE